MTKPIATIGATRARRTFLARQGLGEDPHRRQTPQALLSRIDGLGFVQLDSIATVARAHHMILFARNATYREKDLTRLIERERTLFENWTHDAAVIPVRFYPVWQRRFAREAERLRKRWSQTRRGDFTVEMDAVLSRIAREGPKRARDLLEEPAQQNGGWWDWHPGKTALEYLWRTGALAVSKRVGFEKVYDLSHNVIPQEHRQGPIDHDAYVDFACRSALERLGLATHGELAAFWGLITAEEAKTWAATEGRDLPRVQVEGVCGPQRVAIADPATLDGHEDDFAFPSRLRVVSPFDPIVRDRIRCQRLFGFDYRIEVFVPAHKRRYGYYVFPLLEGDRLVGRIDMKKDKGALTVRKVWWEDGVRPGKARVDRLDAELARVARLCGVTHDGPPTGEDTARH
ncbi:MAG: crosslink repair DNA glycosylase YcaQ family protein [Devosia sp.]